MCKTNLFHNRLYVLFSFGYALFSFNYALFSFGYVLFTFVCVIISFGYTLLPLVVCDFFIRSWALFHIFCVLFVRLSALFIWLWALLIWSCIFFFRLCAFLLCTLFHSVMRFFRFVMCSLSELLPLFIWFCTLFFMSFVSWLKLFWSIWRSLLDFTDSKKRAQIFTTTHAHLLNIIQKNIEVDANMEEILIRIF